MIQCMISEQSISDFYQAQPVTQNPQLFVDKRLCYLHVMESLESLTSDPGWSTSLDPISYLPGKMERA